MMDRQLSLYSPIKVKYQELLTALEKFDFPEAQRLVKEYEKLWPDSRLFWELDVLEFESKWNREQLDLDSGYEVWTKFTMEPFYAAIPDSSRERLQSKYFSRIIASNRTLFGFEESRTAQGRSLGDFFLLAGYPRRAREWFQRERSEFGDTWRIRLRMGNCCSRLEDKKGAYANYRWAYLLGLGQEEYSDIEDADFLNWIREVDDPDWTFAELHVSGKTPARFNDRTESNDFFEQFHPNDSRSLDQQFCIWYVISENRVYCDDDLLLRARRQMKALNPRLHERYMRSL